MFWSDPSLKSVILLSCLMLVFSVAPVSGHGPNHQTITIDYNPITGLTVTAPATCTWTSWTSMSTAPDVLVSCGPSRTVNCWDLAVDARQVGLGDMGAILECESSGSGSSVVGCLTSFASPTCTDSDTTAAGVTDLTCYAAPNGEIDAYTVTCDGHHS